MLSYYLKCRKNTERKPKSHKNMCTAVYGSKKIKFIKEQEASGLLTSILGYRTPLRRIH